MTALIVGVTAAVAILAVLVAGLLRSHAEVLRALHQMGVDLDPAAGSESPDAMSTAYGAPVRFTPAHPAQTRPTPARPDPADVADLVGHTPAGDAVSLAVAGVAHDTLAVFLTSGCKTCRGFWEAFRGGPPDVPGGARLVVVTRGPEAESPSAVAALAGATPVVMSSDAWDRYDIPYAPYFVYVSGPAGRVMGEGVAAGWSEARSLVANAVADGTTAAEPAAATPLPPRSRADRARDLAVDRELAAAGIKPGDPRLHPTSIQAPRTPAP
ncbi:MAG: hypothetical protein ACRDYY_04385 [Acidimicrobiales bacterium]